MQPASQRKKRKRPRKHVRAFSPTCDSLHSFHRKLSLTIPPPGALELRYSVKTCEINISPSHQQLTGDKITGGYSRSASANLLSSTCFIDSPPPELPANCLRLYCRSSVCIETAP